MAYFNVRWTTNPGRDSFISSWDWCVMPCTIYVFAQSNSVDVDDSQSDFIAILTLFTSDCRLIILRTFRSEPNTCNLTDP